MVPDRPTPPAPRPAEKGGAHRTALTGGTTADLEGFVRAYVRELRRADVPPEQALRRVKDAVGVSLATPVSGAPERIRDSVVAWFVAEYYRAD